MASVNKAILVGHLGRDPEVRNTQAGTKIVNLSVATSETWIDKASGERKEATEWHRVVIMNDRIADVAEKYLRKGSKLYIEGKLQTRKWTDKGGQEKYTTEIMIGRFGGELVLLDSKGSSVGTQSNDDYTPRTASRPVGGGMSGHDLDDQIPFAACWQ